MIQFKYKKLHINTVKKVIYILYKLYFIPYIFIEIIASYILSPPTV